MIYLITFILGVWIGFGIHTWLSRRKIEDLYAEIDYLKRTGEGFINGE